MIFFSFSLFLLWARLFVIYLFIYLFIYYAVFFAKIYGKKHSPADNKNPI